MVLSRRREEKGEIIQTNTFKRKVLEICLNKIKRSINEGRRVSFTMITKVRWKKDYGL